MDGLLHVELHTVDDRIKMLASARSDEAITLDYFPPFGNAEGYTPLELLMISLASCTATTLLTLIRGKMRKTVTAMRMRATGKQRDTHPKSLENINLTMEIDSPDLTEEELRTALEAAREKLCPVWAMIKGNVEVGIDYRIIR